MRLLTALARSGWCLKLGCLLLAGCADSDLGPIVVKSVEYHRAEPREFEMPDGRYRVYDKPEKGSLLISWTIGTTAREVRVFGTQEERAPRARFQAAAEKFLRDSGRDCTIRRGSIIAAPHWEFAYTCRPRQ